MLYGIHFIQTCACFLLALSRFTLPGAPGGSSGIYLVIIGDVDAVISFQSTVPPQQRPDLPLVSQPCVWCFFSTPQWNKKGLLEPR